MLESESTTDNFTTPDISKLLKLNGEMIKKESDENNINLWINNGTRNSQKTVDLDMSKLEWDGIWETALEETCMERGVDYNTM